jgi:hypothetical protein
MCMIRQFRLARLGQASARMMKNRTPAAPFDLIFRKAERANPRPPTSAWIYLLEKAKGGRAGRPSPHHHTFESRTR